jgi:sugar O-acyltransferase (sialic acid O-acetyltransferase NeuD family)
VSSDSKPIAIVGSGEHASVVLDLCLCAGRRVAGLIDPEVPRGELVEGLPILGDDRKLSDAAFHAAHDILIGLGDQLVRERLARRVEERGGVLATVVHPRATVARGVALGAGTVVFAGAVINTGTKVGRFSIVHANAVVDHDGCLEDGVQICPGAALAGRTTCEHLAFVGTGATVLPGRTIGARSVVGAGAVVLEDVPPDATVVGNPARIVRTGR